MANEQSPVIEELTPKPHKGGKTVRLNDEVMALVEEVQKVTRRSTVDAVVGLIKRGYRGWVLDRVETQKSQNPNKSSSSSASK